MSLKLTFLGSGASLHSAERQHVNLMLETKNEPTGDSCLLIDANGDTMRRILKAGRDSTALKHIFLTHDHQDHILGLPDLIFQNVVKGHYGEAPHAPEINIYGLQSTLKTAQNLLEAGIYGPLSSKEKVTEICSLKFHSLPNERSERNIGDFVVQSFPVEHDKKPCLGLRVAAKGSSKGMVYSADTSPCDNINEHLSPGDLLVHECYHHTIETLPNHTTFFQIKRLAAGAWADHSVYLVHMSPAMQMEESSLTRELDDLFGGRVQFAHDMQSVKVA